MIEITTLTKQGGPLTKRISLTPDGMLHSDGSACIMSVGIARRCELGNLSQFAHISVTWVRPMQLRSARCVAIYLRPCKLSRSTSSRS